MKKKASPDDVSLAILEELMSERQRQPNKYSVITYAEVQQRARSNLNRKFKDVENVWEKGFNRLLSPNCFEILSMPDGKRFNDHAWLNSRGERLLHDLKLQRKTESKDSQKAFHSRIVLYLMIAGFIASILIFFVQYDY
jgi:cyclopropane fatty-acyl-phospholipid synthase-like methyltransferase